MSTRGAHVGYGLYFIDVLACLLFSLALAITAARFGTERSVEVALPEAAPAEGAGAELPGLELTLRQEGEQTRLYLGAEPLELESLDARLRELAPPSVVVRSEATALSRVIALAHAAGVQEIRLAYRPGSGETAREAGER